LTVATVLPWLLGLAQVTIDEHVRRWRYGVPLLLLPVVEFGIVIVWGFLKYGD